MNKQKHVQQALQGIESYLKSNDSFVSQFVGSHLLKAPDPYQLLIEQKDCGYMVLTEISTDDMFNLYKKHQTEINQLLRYGNSVEMDFVFYSEDLARILNGRDIRLSEILDYRLEEYYFLASVKMVCESIEDFLEAEGYI